MTNFGKIIIISGPSGSGKTTLVKHIVESLGYYFSKSVTTRKMRPGELEDNYEHVEVEEFRERIASGYFLEYEEVYTDKFYGTPKRPVLDEVENGRNVVLEIDVKGAMRIRSLYSDLCFLIFVQPPSIEALKQRLLTRGQMNERDLNERLNRAIMEILHASRFEAVIKNDNLEQAKSEILQAVLTRTRD